MSDSLQVVFWRAKTSMALQVVSLPLGKSASETNSGRLVASSRQGFTHPTGAHGSTLRRYSGLIVVDRTQGRNQWSSGGHDGALADK